MFSGFTSWVSRFSVEGMVLKVTANTTSDARPQSISRMSSTPAKMAMVPSVGRQATSDSRSEGTWPVCSARLAWYRPRQRKGPISRKPALNAST
jgi:hypothetical protein